MSYRHGAFASEVPTSVLPPVETAAGLPVVIGTAPVNMTDEKCVNRPILAHTYDEAVKALGYVPPVAGANGLKKHEFTLCEAVKSHFALFSTSPIVLVNVLDPATHRKGADTDAVTLDAETGSFTVKETGLIPSTVTLTPSESSAYKHGTDYVLSFDDNGYLVISSLGTKGHWNCQTGASLTLAAQKVDVAAVTDEDVMGGVSKGKMTGLELVNEVFPRFGLVPGLIVAPGYSSKAGVAAVMTAKAATVNGLFKAVALIDVPVDTVTDYTAVSEWKNTNNITDPFQVVCWPKVKLDDVEYFMSTQMMGVIGRVDAQNDDIPYVSPSNNSLKASGAIVSDGSEVFLDNQSGAYLNGQGIVTALSFIGGWKAWGNRTACYPAVTDPKDAFICIRRMFNWIANTFILTFWQKVDGPLNRRLIDTILDSANIWMNGLASRGCILGGRITFNPDENPETALMDGKVRFHVYVTPPSPARELDFEIEYDVKYLQNLFG